MPRKSMQILTDSMFYILMALSVKELCGQDITDVIAALTDQRIEIGPATLYTLLSKFLKEGMIEEVSVQGRKRTYRITQYGLEVYQAEKQRLAMCLKDAERIVDYERKKEADSLSFI